MYYNDEIKQKYLATLKLKRFAEALFLKSFETESKYCSDIGNMPSEQVVQVLKKFEYYSINTLRTVCVATNNYREWYAESVLHIEHPQKIFPSDVGMEEAMKKKLFLSWGDIQKELVDYDYGYGNPVAPALALNWLGFKTSEIVSLKKEQIDWKNGLIFDSMHNLIYPMRLTGGVTFEIEPEILKIFEQYANTETSHRVKKHDEYVEQANTEYFIYRMVARNGKRLEAKKYDTSYLNQLTQTAAKIFQDKTGVPSKLLAPSIIASGNMRRVHEYLRTNPHSHEMAYKINIARCTNSPQIPARDIEEMHKEYQKAFNLFYGPNDVYP